MFNSIFGKIITIFIIVLLIGFLLNALMLNRLLEDYASSQKEAVLNHTGEKIIEAFTYMMEDFNQLIVQRVFRQNLEAYSYNTNSLIWLSSRDGTIYFAYSPAGRTSHLENTRLNELQIKNIINGKDSKLIGDFGGMLNGTYLTIIKPIKINNNIVGWVYLHTPIPEVNRIGSDTFRLFVFSAIISTLVAVIVAYLFSKELTKPLKQISQAAKVIAGGEFQKRLAIDSRDEIGELALSFNNMAKNLENQENMRREFVANVTHELRTPMTSLRGFIEGILDGTIPEEKQKDYLLIVKDETERLNRLINTLLDLTRIEAGEKQLDTVSFNINELLRRTVVKLENQIVRKAIMLDAIFEDDDIFVVADKDAIESVIINLLYNAIKFTPDGGKIIISTETVKNKVHIIIKDSGIGIQPDEIHDIWARFYKSDKSRADDKNSSGLGLAIVKAVISAHGEEIWVESEPQKGATFVFTLKKDV